jgi:hypothetical protein
MNVAALQKHLSDLSSFLESASAAKGVRDDLDAICTGLTPFANLALKDFAAFLARAEAFDRTGQVPVTAKAKPKAPKAAAKVAPDVDALARATLSLYERAADPSVTQAEIDDLMEKLNSLTQPVLLTIAEQLGLKVAKSKAKSKIVGEIRSSIEGRKSSYQRSGMLHPQGAGSEG